MVLKGVLAQSINILTQKVNLQFIILNTFLHPFPYLTNNHGEKNPQNATFYDLKIHFLLWVGFCDDLGHSNNPMFTIQCSISL